MKLFLLFLFFISTAYAELEWKNTKHFPIGIVCFTNLGPTFEEGQTSGSQFYYTLSDDCTLYNPNYLESNSFDYVYIDNIEVYIRGTRNNESTTINENTDLVTVTAYPGNRHFYLNGENAKLTLRYLKLVGGDGTSDSGMGGSILIGSNGGELNLYSSIVFNNKAVSGGGIYASGASSTNKNAIMNIYNSIIQNNEATYEGGGIYTVNAIAAIYNTTIDNNIASSSYSGGGMYIEYSDVTMKNTNITNNNAGGGGGLYIWGDSSTVTLRQTSFINNDATNNGDEIYTLDSPTISLINTYFNNTNNNNNIYVDRGTPAWKTCETNNSPCDVEETCTNKTDGKSVMCLRTPTPVTPTPTCDIKIELSHNCTVREQKQGLIDKYKSINNCTKAVQSCVDFETTGTCNDDDTKKAFIEVYKALNQCN
jgi:hypothetical protein